ncbi:integral membrane protein [Mycobacterium bohemicum DSM 44277]|nr:integral membrane protein [Mycobacterium bohemicum DSM 44277]
MSAPTRYRKGDHSHDAIDCAPRTGVLPFGSPPRKQLPDSSFGESTGMNTAYVVVTLATALITGAIAVADLVPAGFVLANSAEVGVPRSWLPVLAALKLAGALGLAAGLLGLRSLGIAAAAGLVLFFVGAVVTHLRARVLYNIAFPGAYLGMSATTLALMMAH